MNRLFVSVALCVASWCSAFTSNLLAQQSSIATTAIPVDSMAQRMSACAACHGEEGRAAADGFYPRIAGKPQEYLYRQLKNFQSQRRNYAPMTHMVKNLSDAYLKEIAQYFSQLELPYAAPAKIEASAALLDRGEVLVKRGDTTKNLPACNACHGESMTGMLPAVPGLLGLPKDYVASQIGAWKEGIRRGTAPDCMKKVAQQLSVDDLNAISTWLALQPVPEKGKPAAQLDVPIAIRCDW